MNGVWIRTQDKNRLIFCSDIEVFKASFCHHVMSNYDKSDSFSLGTYATRDRAFQVLEEIEAHITALDIMHHGGFNVHQIPVVYCMPKE